MTTSGWAAYPWGTFLWGGPSPSTTGLGIHTAFTSDQSVISDTANALTQSVHSSDLSIVSDVATFTGGHITYYASDTSVIIDTVTHNPVAVSVITPDTVSETTLDWWNQMGPWRDADIESALAGNGYPLLTLIDSIGSQYAVTEAYTRDDSTHIGWGQLLDVNVCPAIALPWLAQLAGVVIPIGATESQMRALIIAQANTKRGTAATLIATLQAFLTGTQVVQLYERTPDTYSFTITCQSSQIAGGAGGATAVLALAALIAAKPAGLILSFVVQSGLTWGEMVNYPATTLGLWSDQTDTWASLSNEIPVT